MTPLKKYLDENGIRQSDFAAALKDARGWSATQAQVSRWASGHNIPSMAVRQAIERATGGAVAVDSWTQRKRPGRSASRLTMLLIKADALSGEAHATFAAAAADGWIDPSEADALDDRLGKLVDAMVEIRHLLAETD